MTALVALLLAASAAPPARLLVWHGYRAAEEETLQASLRRFEELNPRYRVELLAVPYDAFAGQLDAALPTDHGPDAFIFAHERIGGWARTGKIAPLDAETAASRGDLIESALPAFQFEGHSYGLPMALKSVALYYNKRLVPTPPRTTDELVRIAREHTGRDAQGRPTYGLAYQAKDFWYHAGWLHGFGGAVFEEPGHTLRTATPEAERALAFVRDLALVYKVIPEEPSSTLISALFRQGQAAMAINGPWFASELEGVEFGVAPLPIVSATGLPAKPFLSVEGALVSARAAEPEGARALVRYLVSRESAVLRAISGRQVVATRSAYDDPRVGGDALLSAFRAQAEASVATDNSPAMQAVWEPEARALVAVLSGGSSPADALAQAQRRMAALIKPVPPARSPWPYAAGLILMVAAGLLIGRARGTFRDRDAGPAGSRLARRRALATAYAYVAPAAASILVLVLVPFAIGVGLSFFHHLEGHYTFVGLHNFVDILASKDYRVTEPMSFWFTLAVTLFWTILNVAFHVGIGLFLALLLRDPLLQFKGLYRVLLIVPWAVPNYITALIWKGMFHRQFGAISHLLKALGIEPIGWFTHFSTAFAANVVTNTWLGFPFMMVVSLGALQSIPGDLYEAAQVDGASKWMQFRHVTLPLLKPALLPAVILGSVWTFNMFNVIYLVSGGEPGGATDILVSEAYRWAFQRNEAYGFAAAYSTLIFLFLLGYSFITRRVSAEAA